MAVCSLYSLCRKASSQDRHVSAQHRPNLDVRTFNIPRISSQQSSKPQDWQIHGATDRHGPGQGAECPCNRTRRMNCRRARCSTAFCLKRSLNILGSRLISQVLPNNLANIVSREKVRPALFVTQVSPVQSLSYHYHFPST